MKVNNIPQVIIPATREFVFTEREAFLIRNILGGNRRDQLVHTIMNVSANLGNFTWEDATRELDALGDSLDDALIRNLDDK